MLSATKEGARWGEGEHTQTQTGNSQIGEHGLRQDPPKVLTEVKKRSEQEKIQSNRTKEGEIRSEKSDLETLGRNSQ